MYHVQGEKQIFRCSSSGQALPLLNMADYKYNWSKIKFVTLQHCLVSLWRQTNIKLSRDLGWLTKNHQCPLWFFFHFFLYFFCFFCTFSAFLLTYILLSAQAPLRLIIMRIRAVCLFLDDFWNECLHCKRIYHTKQKVTSHETYYKHGAIRYSSML